MKTCAVEDCDRAAWARGWCQAHYARWKRHGNPTHVPPKRQPGDPIERFWKKVIKSEGCWEWIGTKAQGYGRFSINRVGIPAHRVSYEMHVGPIPEGMVIDHICHNPGCVNPEHLRPLTIAQNVENRAGAQRNNKSSGVRGVTWVEAHQAWRAQAKHKGKNYYGGEFSTIKEAAEAARQLRLSLFQYSDMDRRTA